MFSVKDAGYCDNINKLILLTYQELKSRNIDPPLNLLVAFCWGKHLSPYSYGDTPQCLADAWQRCKVSDNITKTLSFINGELYAKD